MRNIILKIRRNNMPKMQTQSRTDPSFQVHHINFIYDHQSIHLYFNNTKIQQNDVTYVYNYRVNLQKLIYRLIVIFSDGSARKGLQITKDFKFEPSNFLFQHAQNFLNLLL